MILLTIVRVWFKRHTCMSPSEISLYLGPWGRDLTDTGEELAELECWGVPGAEAGSVEVTSTQASATARVAILCKLAGSSRVYRLYACLSVADDSRRIPRVHRHPRLALFNP